MIKVNRIEALQWQDEALTVKGQSLFLYLKFAHWSFRFVFGIMKLPNTRRIKYENNF